VCPVLPPGQLAPGPHTPHHPMMQPASMQQAAVQYIHHQHQGNVSTITNANSRLSRYLSKQL
jgi:hypothetical protein